MLNSKQIGNITEVEVMLSFLKLGYNVLTPYGDCERYDFVVDVKGKFYKIQCKTSSLSNNGATISFGCKSSHRQAGKIISEKYSSDDIDFFATVYNGKCYLVPVDECSTVKKLRFDLPLNGQLKGISFAKNYELDVMLSTL